MITRRLMIAGLAGGSVIALSSGTQSNPNAKAQTRSYAAPAPAPDVMLDDMVFSANDPATVWQQAGAHTTRAFLRKGDWAVIWYLQQKSPIDAKPFDVVVVERQRWNNLTQERPALSYRATIFGKTFPLNGHGDFQRWVISSRSWPLNDRLLDYWQGQGWLLPWGIGPKLRTPSQWPWMEDVPSYTPLGSGGFTPGMATTGLRDEVGPIVNRQARYIMERSNQMRFVSLNYGLSSASIPWHVRGPDGLPLLLDDPKAHIKLQQYYQNYPEEKIISVSPGMQVSWDIDNAHRPNPSFIPALMSGLHPFFVEQQVFSACAALNAVMPEYRGASGRLLDEGQGRDWAWSMRDVLLAHALLQSMPKVDWLPARERFGAILSANLERAVHVMAKPGLGQLGMFWESGATDYTPNSSSWPAIQTGGREGVYSSTVTNYIPYTLDWGRRLHNDPRWLQLQVQYAQRYQARRFLATGPYSFQHLPARLEGRWASSWQEVARWVNLPANIASQPWYGFDRPVNDPTAYPYETEMPTTVYTGLKLAQATGQAGQEVDNAVAIMESQMRGRASESWAAFAMRHER